MLKNRTARMMSSLELAALSDPISPFHDRLSAPPWVIAAVGIALFFSGIGYFAVRIRRRRLGRGR
jgi:hypothetical protein